MCLAKPFFNVISSYFRSSAQFPLYIWFLEITRPFLTVRLMQTASRKKPRFRRESNVGILSKERKMCLLSQVKGTGAMHMTERYYFSNFKSHFFSEIPEENPPRFPSERITRWQGIIGGTGFFPTAFPTALTAFGLSISLAIHL